MHDVLDTIGAAARTVYAEDFDPCVVADALDDAAEEILSLRSAFTDESERYGNALRAIQEVTDRISAGRWDELLAGPAVRDLLTRGTRVPAECEVLAACRDMS